MSLTRPEYFADGSQDIVAIDSRVALNRTMLVFLLIKESKKRTTFEAAFVVQSFTGCLKDSMI